MVAYFGAKSGHITTIPVEEQRTVTADWYVNHCLPKVFEEVRTLDPRSAITLHHDNAPEHTALATREFVAAEGVQLMSYPPYSPDLAPYDFFVFPHVKSQLLWKRYDSSQEAIRAFTRAI